MRWFLAIALVLILAAPSQAQVTVFHHAAPGGWSGGSSTIYFDGLHHGRYHGGGYGPNPLTYYQGPVARPTYQYRQRRNWRRRQMMYGRSGGWGGYGVISGYGY